MSAIVELKPIFYTFLDLIVIERKSEIRRIIGSIKFCESILVGFTGH